MYAQGDQTALDRKERRCGIALGVQRRHIHAAITVAHESDDRGVEVQRRGGVEFEQRRVVQAVGGRGDERERQTGRKTEDGTEDPSYGHGS